MITARDRKIILTLVPLLLVCGYWFLVLAPKRAESQKVSQELAQAQDARDTAQQQVTQLNGAKSTFPQDYATVVRLGKAVPTSLDMPSLLVQLDRAARGTGIEIDDFKPGAVDAAAAAPGATGSSTSTPVGGGNNPAAPGAAPAEGFPAKQAQNAGQGVDQANQTNQANADKAAATGAEPAAGGPSTSAPGLVAVPVNFTTTGSYFGLADFLHRMKRFVRVVNDQIVVRGRLMTIESFDFARTGPDTSLLKANVTATIYLSPADQGATAGATAQGPGSTSGASSSSSSPSSTPPTSPTPTAVATP
ncbi:MAG TPA: type 4a pilus biogenesis protein PilO [Thermoleophilaceae bacterium]|nr:type 4a pilus biogenesis protein PilO [Thermoleophilaceae bacterium]